MTFFRNSVFRKTRQSDFPEYTPLEWPVTKVMIVLICYEIFIDCDDVNSVDISWLQNKRNSVALFKFIKWFKNNSDNP